MKAAFKTFCRSVERLLNNRTLTLKSPAPSQFLGGQRDVASDVIIGMMLKGPRPNTKPNLAIVAPTVFAGSLVLVLSTVFKVRPIQELLGFLALKVKEVS